MECKAAYPRGRRKVLHLKHYALPKYRINLREAPETKPAVPK
jgi:hypothetical protein